MRKIIKWLRLIFISILLLVIVVIILFWNEIRSLYSIKKIDDYGTFQMTYYGDYGFDDFLKIGAEKDSDIEAFVIKRLLKGFPINLNITAGGCTVFTARNENGDIIYGRNFDFSYSPSLQIITRPDNGYASVSTVNLAFVGYSENNLPSGLNIKSFLTLAAPFLPFDGINEKGVAIALLAVPNAMLIPDDNKITLNTTTAIRMVLDKAANVNEAIELLEQYNIYFSGGIDCHFLIADANGQSALVEYYDGVMQIVTTDENYQIASNFIAYNGLNIGEGFSEFERYEKVKGAIEKNNGFLNENQAIKLLAEVGVIDNGLDKLQWTVLYNLSNLNGIIFANRNIDNLNEFQIK